MAKVKCKDCGKDLGWIDWRKLQFTDEIRCSECALFVMFKEDVTH